MAVKSISSLMRHLKELYDKSNDKSSWRALQGMNRGYYDTFIAGENDLWQIKSEEVNPGEYVAVGSRISSFDEDLDKIMKSGSPVPFGMVTPMNRELSIVMAGVQVYSSDSSNLLCKEHLSSKQSALELRLKNQVDRMMDDPVFRKKYREQKDRVERAYR